MCIDDTLAYTISADSFKVYRIVAPDSFLRLGACADSGYYIAADSDCRLEHRDEELANADWLLTWQGTGLHCW
jgi:hypothetical protein